MSRRRKILLGLLTAWPLVYMVLFMAFVFSMMFLGPMSAEAGAGEGPPALFLGGFGLVFIGHMVTIFLQFGLLGYFLYHVFTRDDLEQNSQILWGLFVFLGGPIGQLVYWWKEIWPEDQLESTDSAAAGGMSDPAEYADPDGRV